MDFFLLEWRDFLVGLLNTRICSFIEKLLTRICRKPPIAFTQIKVTRFLSHPTKAT